MPPEGKSGPPGFGGAFLRDAQALGVLKDAGIIDRADARENLRDMYGMTLPELGAAFEPPRPEPPAPRSVPDGEGEAFDYAGSLPVFEEDDPA